MDTLELNSFTFPVMLIIPLTPHMHARAHTHTHTHNVANQMKKIYIHSKHATSLSSAIL